MTKGRLLVVGLSAFESTAGKFVESMALDAEVTSPQISPDLPRSPHISPPLDAEATPMSSDEHPRGHARSDVATVAFSCVSLHSHPSHSRNALTARHERRAQTVGR